MGNQCYTIRYNPLQRSRKNKKAELLQRRPCDVPYTWVPWKISGVPDNVHARREKPRFYGKKVFRLYAFLKFFVRF